MRKALFLFTAICLAACAPKADEFPWTQAPDIHSPEVEADIYSAVLSARLSRSGGITAFGFVLDGEEGTYERKASALADRMFSLSLEDLVPSTEYSCRAFFDNGRKRVYSEQTRFKTMDTPHWEAIQTTPDLFSVSLEARVNAMEQVDDCGFLLWIDDPEGMTLPGEKRSSGFRAACSGLSADTDYSAQAWFTCRGHLFETEVFRFHTGRTPAVSGITAETDVFDARIECTLTAAPDPGSFTFWIAEAEEAFPYPPTAGEGNLSYSLSLTGLIPNHTYRYSVAYTIQGHACQSETGAFRTLPESRSRITETGVHAGVFDALLTASVYLERGITSRGFLLRTEEGDTQEYTVEADGLQFQFLAEGLSPATAYWFQAFADAYGRRFLSEEKMFYTLPRPFEDIRFEALACTPGTDNRVTLEAVLSYADGLTECGFGISDNNRDYIEYNASLEGNTMRTTLSALSPGIAYHYYAFFFYQGQRGQSVTNTFTLP